MTTQPKPANPINELGAIFEIIGHFMSRPVFDAFPQGDGHPVVVIPGFLASRVSTTQLRHMLKRKGYRVKDWGQGRNMGYSDARVEGVTGLIEHLHAKTGQKVSIVGWSLGGMYARLISNQTPDVVRQVITLGSPFAMPLQETLNNEELRVAKVYRALNPNADDALEKAELWQNTPPVPTTSIWTRNDGVVHYSHCREPDGPNNTSIEVKASHLGLGHNSSVLAHVLNQLEKNA